MAAPPYAAPRCRWQVQQGRAPEGSVSGMGRTDVADDFNGWLWRLIETLCSPAEVTGDEATTPAG